MSLILQLEAYQRVQSRISQLQLNGRHSEAQRLSDVLEQIINSKKETIVNTPNHNGDFAELKQLLSDTIEEIRVLTDLKAKASITYDRVTIESVKKALIADNLRMEQFQFNLTITETERFHSFCNSAFKQIENLLNYYYYCKYPDFKDCVIYFKRKGTEFKGGKDPLKISQIQSHSKLNCFERDYYYDPLGKVFYDSQLDLIRHVRNLEAHRCDVYVQDYEKHRIAYQTLLDKITGFKRNGLVYPKDKKDERIEADGKLAFFLKEQNFELVREEIRSLYDKVTQNLT